MKDHMSGKECSHQMLHGSHCHPMHRTPPAHTTGTPLDAGFHNRTGNTRFPLQSGNEPEGGSRSQNCLLPVFPAESADAYRPRIKYNIRYFAELKIGT